MQIQEKLKFYTSFEWIGGEANVKALVERFYDLMMAFKRFPWQIRRQPDVERRLGVAGKKLHR